MKDQLSIKKRSILDRLLVCPSCQGDLKDEQDQYACGICQARYTVDAGVPRFVRPLSGRERQVCRSFDLEHRRYLDSRHLHFTSKLIEDWLQEIRLPRDYFKGKLVLDAGCGSGRWTYAMATLGATVVAVDFTEAGTAITHQATGLMENVVVLQGSILQLPFRQASFDLVVSWGVLHHTFDTKQAFDCVARLVRPGGLLYVMIYERQNPLKSILTNVLRMGLQRFSETRRYEFCRGLIIRNRRLAKVLQHLVISVYHPPAADDLELSTLQLGLYDAYSPTYNHLHALEEVQGWFQSRAFDDITLTRPDQLRTGLDAWLAGTCGGSLKVRGRRR